MCRQRNQTQTTYFILQWIRMEYREMQFEAVPPYTMAHGNGKIKLGWHEKGFAFFLRIDRNESTCTLHTAAKLPATSTVCQNVPIMHRSIYTFMLLQLIMEVSKGQGGNLCGNRMIQWERAEAREKEREAERGSWPWLNRFPSYY